MLNSKIMPEPFLRGNELTSMHKVSRLQAITGYSAPILLGTYVLITLSRWLHPALFDDIAATIILVIAVGLTTVYVLLSTRDGQD